MKFNFKTYWLFLFFISITPLKAQTGGDAIIYTNNYIGEKIEYFFYDIKQSLNSLSNTEKCEILYQDHDMNGVRVSILGNDKDGFRAHPEAGTVVAEYYDNMINSIENARAARGNKDFYVFASKKLAGDNSFPDWVKDENGVMVSEYVTMLSDYLRYMKYKGIDIDYLGIQNEEVYNEGNITAAKHADIIDSLRVRSQTESWDMPLIVGYEDFGPNKAVISGTGSFISNLSALGKLDRMDVYGTHYYPAWRPLSNLQKDLAYLGDMPFWSTEPHWDAKSDVDDFEEAIPAIMTLWDQVEAGMTGFMWWSYQYSSTTALRPNLMPAFSVPIKDARAILMDDIDGPFIKGDKTYTRLETYAFREDNIITVYVLNNTENVYTDYGFKVDQGSISGRIACTQWLKEGDVQGTTGTFSTTSDQQFNYDIPAYSISYLSFSFEDETSALAENATATQVKLYPSVTSSTVYLQNNQAQDYQVYSINGKMILNSNLDQINVSTWPKGIYILKTSSGQSLKFSKI